MIKRSKETSVRAPLPENIPIALLGASHHLAGDKRLRPI